MLMNREVRPTNEIGDASFRWATGFEGSFIPHLSIDQYEWTQHDRFWRNDFKRLAEDLGCAWVRYPLPWHLLEPKAREYNWKWFDERLTVAEKLGLKLMVDFTHFGTPAWLPKAFGDLEFPEALERFSIEFAGQYRGRIPSVCPVNEPLITALFCGDVGLWPPHGRSLRTYMTLVSRLTFGLSRSIRALRERMPEAEVIICDALEAASIWPEERFNNDAGLREMMRQDVERRNARRHLIMDLLTGRVDESHALYSWLLEHGFPSWDLNWFRNNRQQPDVLGLDYYRHTEVEIYSDPEGRIRQRVPERLAGLCEAASPYWERYGLPLMITETSASGSDEDRIRWLEQTVEDVRRLRARGVPVLGYTWWPFTDHLDWDGALLHRVGHIHPVGIYRLVRGAHGKLHREETGLLQAYRDLIKRGEEGAGAYIPANENTPNSNHMKNIINHSELSYPIIVHCHLRWDGVWQRPQQFLSRLSQRHRVLFVEGPLLHETGEPPTFTLKQAEGYPNVTIMQTHFPASRFGDGAWVDKERYRLLKQALRGPLRGQYNKTVQWFYDPMATTPFAGKIEEIAIIYDCMDELSQFRFAPPELVTRERELLSKAHVVFAGGRKMCESKGRYNGNCHFYGCGVDVKHFAKARLAETETPTDISFISKPMLGYFGVVDERIDYELLEKMARTNPDWNIVMIGPFAKVDPNSAPRVPNLYWLGRREYAQLPNYTKAFDVCLMPFAMNEATEYINPTKALEYMATGRLIVSTPVPDVVSNFGKVVKIGHTHEEFIDLCRAAIQEPDAEAIARGLKMADENQWETIVAKLEEHIHDVLRPSLTVGTPVGGAIEEDLSLATA